MRQSVHTEVQGVSPPLVKEEVSKEIHQRVKEKMDALSDTSNVIIEIPLRKDKEVNTE